MGTKTYEKINHKTGDKITTTVSRYSSTTEVKKVLKKSHGLLGTRFLGSEKTLAHKS